MGRPILSPGKKLTGGKFRPVTPVSIRNIEVKQCMDGKSGMRDQTSLLTEEYKSENGKDHILQISNSIVAKF